MRCSVSRDELKACLAVVCKVTSTSSTRTELACVHLMATSDVVELSSTDGVYSVRLGMQALADIPGSALIPAARLSDVVRSMADGAITIDATEAAAQITCGSAVLRLPARDPRDFPAFPRVEPENSLSISSVVLNNATARAAKFCAKPGKDGVMTCICGVLLDWSDGELRIVSTDSYRVSIERIALANADASGSVIVPPRILQDAAALGDVRMTEIGYSANQIVIRVAECEFVARRIEGNYPNWRMFDKSDCVSASSTFALCDLGGAVSRACALGRSDGAVRMTISDGSSQAEMSRDAGADGLSKEDLPCSGGKGTASVYLHPLYARETVSVMPTDNVIVEIGVGRNPVLFKSSDNAYRCAVMPTRAR